MTSVANRGNSICRVSERFFEQEKTEETEDMHGKYLAIKSAYR